MNAIGCNKESVNHKTVRKGRNKCTKGSQLLLCRYLLVSAAPIQHVSGDGEVPEDLRVDHHNATSHIEERR